jgi:hypothetical protein
MGRSDVTQVDLRSVAENMPQGAIGRQGISPDVLIRWATTERSHDLEIIPGVERFKTSTGLKRVLRQDGRTLFLLVSVVVREGNYSHMVCIDPDEVLMDSELPGPLSVSSAEKYKTVFKRYTSVQAVWAVKSAPVVPHRVSSKMEVYDLT